MDSRREKILLLDLLEAAVGRAFGEDDVVGGGGGVESPAEDGAVEFLDAVEVQAGDLRP